MLSTKLKDAIRDIPDFPRKGIVFKDITPILKDAVLCSLIIDEFVRQIDIRQVDLIAGIESRGFLFGLMLANRLQVPFVPIRKKGKLPAETIQEACELEYGSTILELHADAFLPGQKVMIHDDLLATGGTVLAAARLIERLGGIVTGYTFVVSLDFLNGKDKIRSVSENIISLVSY